MIVNQLYAYHTLVGYFPYTIPWWGFQYFFLAQGIFFLGKNFHPPPYRQVLVFWGFFGKDASAAWLDWVDLVAEGGRVDSVILPLLIDGGRRLG
jgi:hypothetical protein